MITRIREVRRARGMTLDEVAQACVPATTPQTIVRLETGTRTVSVGWLNRIAAALKVDAADLVDHPERAELPVVAVLGGNGATAPKKQALVVPPRPATGQIAMTVAASVGEALGGDDQGFGVRGIALERKGGDLLFCHDSRSRAYAIAPPPDAAL